MFSLRKQEEKAKQPATRELLQRGEKVIQIPSFYGEFDPNTYLEWEKDVDFFFHSHRYKAERQVQLATTGLCGYALDWWYQLANHRRHIGELQISSWYEMKAVMKKRFVAKRYGQTDLERMHSQSVSAKGRARTPKDEPKLYYGGEAARKLQQYQAYVEELQSPQFKQQLRNMINQSLTAVVNNPQKRSLPRPASRDDEQSCYQKEPAEKKEETAAKQGERALEPATSCQGDYLHNDLKQEERSLVICDHVPGQNKAEEGVLIGSPTAHELAVIAVVQEGDIIKSFSCDLLIKPPVWIQPSIVDHLRLVKGLQHLVFEPGGNFCVHKSITSNLIQIAAALKLELEGFLHDQEEPMLVSGFSKLRPRAQKSKIKACSWYQWGEVQSEAVRSKLNNEKEQCALSVVCNGNISPGYLRHVRGLQFFVFDPGGELYVLKFLIAIVAIVLEHKENGSISLQGSDLRTNPF